MQSLRTFRGATTPTRHDHDPPSAGLHSASPEVTLGNAFEHVFADPSHSSWALSNTSSRRIYGNVQR
jgi:hypothetical protein